VRRQSCGSVRTAFLDKEQAITEVAERARELLAQDERVVAIGLFGSLARGDALPSSDADVLIALSQHPQTRWFDRIPEYQAAFSHTSLPVEPFPYTLDELTGMASPAGFLHSALRDLVPLAGEARIWDTFRAVCRVADPASRQA